MAAKIKLVVKFPKDGDSVKHWYRRNGKAVFSTVCCDCSLVHHFIAKGTKRYITLTAWRDDKLTDSLREEK